MKAPNRLIVPLTILSLMGADPALAQARAGQGRQQAAPRQMSQGRPQVQRQMPQQRPSYQPRPQSQPRPSYQPRPQVQRQQAQPRPSYQPRPQVRPQSQPRPQVRPQVQQRPQIQRPTPQRPTIQPRPTPRPAIQGNRPAQVRPSVTPGNPSIRPTPGRGGNNITPRPPGTRPGISPGIVKRPDLTPGRGVNPTIRPGRVPGGRTDLTPGIPGSGGRAADVVRRQQQPYRNTLRPGGGRISRPVMTRPMERFLPGRPATARINPAWSNRWGGWGRWASNPAARANFNAAYIGRNYRRALNWNYRPNCWGSRPWWTASASHRWHYGCWNYGWKPYWYQRNCWYYPRPWPGYSISYYRPVSWGLVCWGLGSQIYDTGYSVYTNPYVPEPYSYGSTVIRYEQPMSVLASEYPTGNETESDLAETRAAEALDRSREAFLREDYLTALKGVDEAISYQPGDSAQHEYRALVLFALGKYDDAAGVLNSVLASGPGWDRQTMIGFYRSEDTYLAQLAKLEGYVGSAPGRAAPRFLLGYHHLVSGQFDDAEREFGEVARLQPSDNIARQLRDLAKNSTGENAEKQVEQTMPDPANDPPVESLSAQELVGTWTSNRGENGIVVLSLRDDGNFTWNFTRGDQKNDLTGTYEIDDRGLLVLTTADSQMVGKVTLPAAKKMSFVLEGGPEGDPGISFDQTP